MVIRRVNPMSVAKVGGALYGLIGLIIGACVSLIFVAVGASAQSARPGGALVGMLFGAGAIVVMPIFYGVGGFIGAALSALLYNFLAGNIGGIEIEVDTEPATPR
jgi:hypothetical protein